MKTVSREARVSQGILHYYFADKRAMLVATLATVTRDLDRRVAAAQSRTTRDPAARLRALVRACLEVAVRRPEVWVVFLEFWGEMVHDRALRAVNPERAAAVVLGLVDGVSLQLTFDPRAFSVAEAARLCDAALARYLAREETPC